MREYVVLYVIDIVYYLRVREKEDDSKMKKKVGKALHQVNDFVFCSVYGKGNRRNGPPIRVQKYKRNQRLYK